MVRQPCPEPLFFEPCCLENKIDEQKPNQWPPIPLVLEHENELQEYPPNRVGLDNTNKNSSNNFDHENSSKGDADGWNILQSLSSKNKQANPDEHVYVHPLVKKSSSMLRLKSLEMCTESLGSESGDEFSHPLSPNTNEDYHQFWRLKYEKSSKKVPGNTNFPPPLSSISGSENVQVTPHREGGRLVLKVAKSCPCSSYFQAERVDGRLRLCLVKDGSPTRKEVEIDGEYEQEEEEEEYDDYDDENWVDDIGGNNENAGCEAGIVDRPIPRSCKESGHENKAIPNWEPYWVAIS